MRNVFFDSRRMFPGKGGAAARHSHDAGRAAFAVLMGAYCLSILLVGQLLFGCGGATCDRIQADRTTFLNRQPTANGPHIELTLPFVIANRLIEPHIAKIPPIEIPLSGLGNLAGYFGAFSAAPTRMTLRAATQDHLGFRLDFEVRRNGQKAFGMFLESEVQPVIDLATGKVTIGFTPDVLQKAKPGLARDAKEDLSELIYTQIPAPARLLVSRDMVNSVVGPALDRLIETFFAKARTSMLPRLSDMSQLSFSLPNVPLAAVNITSSNLNGGFLQLAITTSLPTRKGLVASKAGDDAVSRHYITLRTSGPVAAELVNWAMLQKRLPDRYNDKGKPKKDGAFWPGIDWMSGDDRPMKIYLWDLEKPCMRLDMSAKPALAVKSGNIEIAAEGAETDSVDASAVAKVGVWFRLLWKDAVNVNKKSSARIKTTVAGKEMTAVVERAEISGDAITIELYLTEGAS